MSFTIFYIEKTTLQPIKTQSSKSRKIKIFPKGLTHGFGPKMALFPTFFLGNIGQENVFLRYSTSKKTPLQPIKTRSSKTQKIDIFPKGLTNGFGPKMDNFPTFFFQAIEASKMSFTIFWNEQRPFKPIKTRSSKSRKIEIFPKGITHGFRRKMAIFPTFLFQAIQARKMSFTIF